MDFSLDEETIMLKESASRFLTEKSPAFCVKALAEGKDGFSKTLWQEMAGLGWFGMIYEEAYGGFEASFFDLFVLCEEMGKVVLQSPFFCSAVLSGMLLNETNRPDQKMAYLPPIISGEKILTTALIDESGQYDHQNPKIHARKTREDTYEITGTRLLVPFAHVADAVLVCAKLEDAESEGGTIFMIDREAAGLEFAPLETLTQERSYALTFTNVEVSQDKIMGSPGQGSTYVDRVWHRAMILKCGEMLGGLSKVLDMTVSHVQGRQQFGRPLSAFQAVQHNCADMSILFETTRLITYQAASLISQGIPCLKEVAMAKAWCGEAYKKCTWIGHQLHGAIGFTEEHDMHLYYKHAKASEMAFGSTWAARSTVAENMGM